MNWRTLDQLLADVEDAVPPSSGTFEIIQHGTSQSTTDFTEAERIGRGPTKGLIFFIPGGQ